MIHPATELRFVSESIGFGVFATALIPMGSITYVKDALEVELSPEEFHTLADGLRPIVDKYSYIDQRGVRVLSWDYGKYVNHCCDSNTMSTGYGFEIAVRDIPAGEELTDEYGLFNLPEAMTVSCPGKSDCRRIVQAGDIRDHAARWDRQVQEALSRLRGTPQPLWEAMPSDARAAVEAYLDGSDSYRSVTTLEYRKSASAPHTETSSAA